MDLTSDQTDDDTQLEDESTDSALSSSDNDLEEKTSIIQDGNAQQEIEGDFDRLVKNIRLQDTSSSSSNLLAKEWDFDLAEKDAEFKDDLRAASGIGRARRTGRRTGPILSQQVKSLIGDGNQAYVDSNIPEAIRVMKEVIRIEPRAVSAWSVLAQCYEDINENKKALQLRIMAAHLRHDAEEWDRLARQSREHGYNQQALYCYRKVYRLDPTNVDALWDRASLAREMGELRTAKHAYLAILKRFPHDLVVLREFHTTLVELSELGLCSSFLQAALDHYMATYPSSKDTNVTGMDLLLLADLYNVLGEYQEAIHVIRRGTRWIQGRASQKIWDVCEDDREYDMEEWPTRFNSGESVSIEPGHYALDTNTRHRLAIARIKMGDIEEGKLQANAILMEDVLDYSILFAEIADAYFEKDMFTEAKPIYEQLGGNPATSSIYILLQTAACLRNVDELKEAAEVYEHVRRADPTNNEAKMKLAEIYEIMNQPRRALDLVYEVIESRKKRHKASTNVTQAPEESSPSASISLFTEDKTTASGARGGKSSSSARQNRVTHGQLKELEAEKEKDVVRGYKRLKEIWAGMLVGDDNLDREWMLEAEKLVDMFRETRNLFLTSRSNPFRGMFPTRMKKRQGTEADEDDMASRLQLDLERDSIWKKSTKQGEKTEAVNVFRGVSFDDWLRLFMQYCFNLTRKGQFETADEVLRHIMVSNAYQARERQDSIRVALITCAIHADRPDIVVEQCRKLINQHQFNNEPLRILIASLASGLRNTDGFITSTLQKHLFREMKLSDMAVKNPGNLRWNGLSKRYALKVGTTGKGLGGGEGEGEEEGDEGEQRDEEVGGSEEENGLKTTGAPPLPRKENALIVTIYGQICIAAKSYQSAIFYLLHAYDYCPDDPMICLCLAIASIGRAMQRQSDNRHHLIVQAMAFLTQYRKLRSSMDESDRWLGSREVEYNFARMFHQLGLYSHAVKHYEIVLELAEKAGDDMFACEAAYNLGQIFVFTGAIGLGDKLCRRWLSL